MNETQRKIKAVTDCFAKDLNSMGGRSKHTLRNYGYNIQIFCNFLQENYPRFAKKGDFKIVDRNILRAFLTNLSRRQKASSVSNRMYALKSFFNFLVRERYIPVSPFLYMDRMKAPQRDLPAFLNLDETFALLDSISGNDFDSLRDGAALELLYSTGVRVSELVDLNWENVDARAGFIKVEHGKGDKQRVIPVGENALERLWLYGKICRSKWGIDPSGKQAIFLSQLGQGRIVTKGRRITTRSVARLLNKRLKLAGVEKHIGPHGLRHSFATHLLRDGADLSAIKDMLGHETLDITQKYTHVNLDHLTSAYAKAHPRA